MFMESRKITAGCRKQTLHQITMMLFRDDARFQPIHKWTDREVGPLINTDFCWTQHFKR